MRPLIERTSDFREAYLPLTEQTLQDQARRCMSCGVPFCHEGCPLGNPIPEFNDLVQQGRWREAYRELSRTNPFPEFTGKACPAPCEDACVLTIIDRAVTIKNIELAVIEHAFSAGWVRPIEPTTETGKTVAVVGSGPAGICHAHALRLAGHSVIVYERSDRIGGLIRYGVPDYKMDKKLIDRRIGVLEQSGIRFVTECEIGRDLPMETLAEQFDAVAICVGALKARDLAIPGREREGVRLAMDYLTNQNRIVAGDEGDPSLDAQGKNVVILGGGDTGADCFGTAIRQDASSVTQLNHYPEPGEFAPGDSWPFTDPRKHAFVYDEGGEREWGIQAVAITDAGVETIDVWRQGRLRVPIPNTVKTIPADLVLIAIGFEGAELSGIGLGGDGGLATAGGLPDPIRGIFAAGDVRRVQA